jgi:Uma2 family endonuclease
MATNPKNVPQHYYSLEEYFALERASDARFEYWDGDIVCMSGGSRAHYQISSNIHLALGLALRGGRCRAFTGDAAIWTPTLPPYRYPDVSVACGELEYKNKNGLDALINPVLVVEVTSPSTVTLDEGPKFVAYQAIPTLRDYLLVSQDEPHVTHYTRLEGGTWERRDVTDPDASLELESVGCALRLREIYDGVTFPT